MIKLAKFLEQGQQFMDFSGACGGSSCHDGALVQALVETDGWTYATHDLGVCAFYHNPNPQSCSIVGGVYLDSLDYWKAGCYDLNELPLPWQTINWKNFVQSDIPCVCEHYEDFSKLFSEP